MVQRFEKKRSGDSHVDTRTEETSDRKRLKQLAISRGILSATPTSSRSALNLSKTVLKHHGTDILRKSQRKNRYLFSFPGLLGPVNGGKIGDLKDLGTKNPVLYLDFPQGRLKLFGTIVYPKNRYLTLQFSRGGKNVMCEDYFDNMIVFSDAWWIGQKEENPGESKLDIPKELFETPKVECNFRGGAGVPGTECADQHRRVIKNAEGLPNHETEEKKGTEIKKSVDQTPTRSSGRLAGRKSNSSGKDGSGCEVEAADSDSNDTETKAKYNIPSQRILDDGDATELSIKDAPSHGPLVQSTVSSMFQKVLEKKLAENNTTSKISNGKNAPKSNTKRKSDAVDTAKNSSSRCRRMAKEKVEVDDIEELSTSSEDSNDSDEDWNS